MGFFAPENRKKLIWLLGGIFVGVLIGIVAITISPISGNSCVSVVINSNFEVCNLLLLVRNQYPFLLLFLI